VSFGGFARTEELAESALRRQRSAALATDVQHRILARANERRSASSLGADGSRRKRRSDESSRLNQEPVLEQVAPPPDYQRHRCSVGPTYSTVVRLGGAVVSPHCCSRSYCALTASALNSFADRRATSAPQLRTSEPSKMGPRPARASSKQGSAWDCYSFAESLLGCRSCSRDFGSAGKPHSFFAASRT